MNRRIILSVFVLTFIINIIESPFVMSQSVLSGSQGNKVAVIDSKSEAPLGESENTVNYYPLKTGAEWTLEGVETTPTITNKILDTEMIEDRAYSKIETSHVFNDDAQSAIIFERIEGSRVYRLNPPEKEELLFDFSIGVNQKWKKTYDRVNKARIIRTGRVIDFDMTVNVPAGIFEKCIVYEITDTTIKTDEITYSVIYTYWLAPDIGIVKQSLYVTNGGVILDTWINNLTAYTNPEQ
ncbi:hypothetical protein ACFL6P_07120 [Candidatus Latescibacterota bacterium]